MDKSDDPGMENENEGQEQIELEIRKYERRMRNNQIFFKAFFIFLIELAFCIFIIQYYKTYNYDESAVKYGTYVLKYCCMISIHIMMQPRILNGIERLDYLIKYPYKFEQVLVPQCICWMKLIIELLVELAMIISTGYENDNLYMVMDFSALTVISYIDQYYYESLKWPLKTKMESVTLKLPAEPRKDPQVLKGSQKFFNSLKFLMSVFYETFYFHFVPYVALLYALVGFSNE